MSEAHELDFDVSSSSALGQAEGTIEKTTLSILPFCQTESIPFEHNISNTKLELTPPTNLPNDKSNNTNLQLLEQATQQARDQLEFENEKKLFEIKLLQHQFDIAHLHKEQALFESTKTSFETHQQYTINNLKLKKKKIQHELKQQYNKLNTDIMLFEQHKIMWLNLHRDEMLQSLASFPHSTLPTSSYQQLNVESGSTEMMGYKERDLSLTSSETELLTLQPGVFVSQSTAQSGTFDNESNRHGNLDQYGSLDQSYLNGSPNQPSDTSAFTPLVELARAERTQAITENIDSTIDRSLDLLNAIRIMNKKLQRREVTCARNEEYIQNQFSRLKSAKQKVCSYISFIKKRNKKKALHFSKSLEFRRMTKMMLAYRRDVLKLGKENQSHIDTAVSMNKAMVAQNDEVSGLKVLISQLKIQIGHMPEVITDPMAEAWHKKSKDDSLTQLERQLIINQNSWHIFPSKSTVRIVIDVKGSLETVTGEARSTGLRAFFNAFVKCDPLLTETMKGGTKPIFFSSPDILNGQKVLLRKCSLIQNSTMPNDDIFGDKFVFPLSALCHYPGTKQYCETCKSISTQCTKASQHSGAYIPYFKITMDW